MPLPLTLIVNKEERFVLLDGPTQRASELIQIELLFGRSKIASCVEFGIAKELEQRPVKLVRSGLRRDQNSRAGSRTVLCRVVVG